MKRCISFFLALILLLSLVPAFAFAGGGTFYRQASSQIIDLIKKYEGCVLTAYQDAFGTWTIGYGHTGYVPCKDAYVSSGMTLTQQEADDLLAADINDTYTPSVNNFVNNHRDLYPDGLTQYEFDVLVSLAFCFGAYWIDHYKDQYRMCKYLLSGMHNYSDDEIADAMVCLWSGLPGLLKRRMEEARIFLYGDYDGTGSRQLAYLKFDGATTVFSEEARSGNKVACYIVGSSYGELPTAQNTNGYFAGWKTPDGKILSSSDIVRSSMEVTATWSSSYPISSTSYWLNVTGGSSSGSYTSGAVVTVIPDSSASRNFSYWSGSLTPWTNGNGTYSFVMPDWDVSITANFSGEKCPYGDKCPSKSFTDVPEDYWAHNEIDYVVASNLFKGTSTTQFSPELSMTRGMLVTVLYRMAGSPSVSGLENPFSDVVYNDYYNAILWAYSKNITTGFTDGSFRPGIPVSREQFATFLQRFASNIYGMDTESAPSANLGDYSDGYTVAPAFRQSMSWALGEGIIKGTSATTLSPSAPASRAQVAVILSRFMENS